MSELRVYELSQVAMLAGVDISQAKNWTNGRVLHIYASIRQANGKGARNLFNEKDVLKVYIANELNMFGFSPKGTIEEILQKFDEMYAKDGFDRIAKNPWLVIQNSGNAWKVFLREERGFKLTFSLEDRVLLLSLNLSQIKQQILEGNPKKKGEK